MVIAEKCPCGRCSTYGVSNGTFYQGCGWEKEDAEFVAWCFNNRATIQEFVNQKEQGEKSSD